MSSDYYGSYDIAAAERARIAKARERKVAEQRRREEELADGRERDAVTSRFSDGEWHRAVLLDRLAAITAAARTHGDVTLVHRCESLRNAPGDTAELEKKIAEMDLSTQTACPQEPDAGRQVTDMVQRVGLLLHHLPPQVERMFASQLERVRSIVAAERDAETLRWVDLTLTTIVQEAPAIQARYRAVLEVQQRNLTELLVRTRAIASLASSANVEDAAWSLVKSLDDATRIDDAAEAARAVELLKPRVKQLELDFAEAHDAKATRDYVLNNVAEVLEELGYTPIVGSAAVESVDFSARGLFATPDGQVVEARIAVDRQAHFEFKARSTSTSQGELVEKCATWCADLEGARAVLATRGVFVHEVSRVPAGKKPIAVTAVPLPREDRPQLKRRRKRRGVSTLARKA